MSNPGYSVVPFIPQEFPKYMLTEGPNMVQFIQDYYAWMQLPQSGNTNAGVLWYNQNFLNITDIDFTPPQFLSHFAYQFMNSLPGDMETDPRLFLKHIVDLYISKGSSRGFEILFRALYDEDVQIYTPWKDAFRASDNTWMENSYIEVSSSPYLPLLIGCKITNLEGTASAFVEDFNVLTLKNRVINILTLSGVQGSFPYGCFIVSPQVSQLNPMNAPQTVGSLSSISVLNGGAFFNVGDIVNVQGSGSGALAKVTSTTEQTGQVFFSLENGGLGFSLNAVVSVLGGNGTGATFRVGSIANSLVFNIGLDIVNTFLSTTLDSATAGFTLDIGSLTGTFQNGETVNAVANAIILDFAYITGNNLTIGETMSNTSLGINNLIVSYTDNPSLVCLMALADASLLNANLVPGNLLIGGTSGDVIFINSVLPKVQYQANGTVLSQNSTVVVVNEANGYFLPLSILHGQTSAAHANITQTLRNTSWNFSGDSNSNLNTPLSTAIIVESLSVGTITSLIDQNPGASYATSPIVSILEPLIAELQIPDGGGGFWGEDANVIAQAIDANGIATSLQIITSGYGFIPGEALECIGSNTSFAITGVAVVDGTGKQEGFWTSDSGFLSDINLLQDSFYVDPYAYEIQAPRDLSQYGNVVINTMHPVGYNMFGRFKIVDDQQTQSNATYFNLSQHT